MVRNGGQPAPMRRNILHITGRGRRTSLKKQKQKERGLGVFRQEKRKRGRIAGSETAPSLVPIVKELQRKQNPAGKKDFFAIRGQAQNVDPGKGPMGRYKGSRA